MGRKGDIWGVGTVSVFGNVYDAFFLMFQAVIFNVAAINFQCAMERPMEKFPI